jgi:hypothetical protein
MRVKAKTQKETSQNESVVKEQILHPLLKVRNENGQTINAHAAMIAKNGTAMFGKMGPPVSEEFIDILNEQIRREIMTYLFITTRQGWNGEFVTYRCQLLNVSKIIDEARKSLVPSYYVYEIPGIRTWFLISDLERLTREEMNRIVVVSSGRALMSVINSSATFFQVTIS